jgi:hypothetical protein
LDSIHFQVSSADLAYRVRAGITPTDYRLLTA